MGRLEVDVCNHRWTYLNSPVINIHSETNIAQWVVSAPSLVPCDGLYRVLLGCGNHLSTLPLSLRDTSNCNGYLYQHSVATRPGNPGDIPTVSQNNIILLSHVGTAGTVAVRLATNP